MQLSLQQHHSAAVWRRTSTHRTRARRPGDSPDSACANESSGNMRRATVTPGASHTGEGDVPSESTRLEQKALCRGDKIRSFSLTLLVLNSCV